MSGKTYRGMKRIGTVGNYMKITPENEYLLNDRKMIEVVLVEDEDGKISEDGTTPADALASKDLARIASELLAIESRHDSLIAHAMTLVGGEKMLEELGIEAPEQSIHTETEQLNANNEKQKEKATLTKAQTRRARRKRRKELLKADRESRSRKLPAPSHVDDSTTETNSSLVNDLTGNEDVGNDNNAPKTEVEVEVDFGSGNDEDI